MRRRITAFGEHNEPNERNESMILKKMSTFIMETLWISLYWKLYRCLILTPKREKEFGSHVKEFLIHDDRSSAVYSIMAKVQHVLSIPYTNRSHDDILLLAAILKQKNQFYDKYCSEWKVYHLLKFCKKIHFHKVHAFHKVQKLLFIFSKINTIYIVYMM